MDSEPPSARVPSRDEYAGDEEAGVIAHRCVALLVRIRPPWDAQATATLGRPLEQRVVNYKLFPTISLLVPPNPLSTRYKLRAELIAELIMAL